MRRVTFRQRRCIRGVVRREPARRAPRSLASAAPAATSVPEWRLCVQPAMGPAMVVTDVLAQDALCVSLIRDDHVVEAFPPKGPDHSFAIRIRVGHQLHVMGTVQRQPSA